jgi:hypothetical protein
MRLTEFIEMVTGQQLQPYQIHLLDWLGQEEFARMEQRVGRYLTGSGGFIYMGVDMSHKDRMSITIAETSHGITYIIDSLVIDTENLDLPFVEAVLKFQGAAVQEEIKVIVDEYKVPTDYLATPMKKIKPLPYYHGKRRF